MAVVRYPHFREYSVAREDANTAIMGLLAGSRLAAHVLRLTHGSSLQLGQIFPSVEHINRFNLKSSVASEILENAEVHLGSMALPYVLALHEDYNMRCGEMLRAEGILSRTRFNKLNPKNFYGTIEESLNSSFDGDSVVVFHVFRLIRNCLIHFGGQASQELVDHVVAEATPGVRALWERLTHSTFPAFRLGEELKVTQPEMGAVLSVTKFLAEQMNEMLAGVISRARWSDILVADVVASDRRKVNRLQMERRVAGHARQNYLPLALTAAEIDEAMIRAGM